MKKGHPETHEQRCRLLKIFTDAHTPASIMQKHSERMRDKTDEEKERIAAQIILEIEAGKIDLS